MTISNHATAIAAGTVLFSAMAIVGWRLQTGDSVAESSPQISTHEVRNSRRSEPSSVPDHGRAAAKRLLRAIQAETSPQERLRATTALVNQLSPEELLTWLDQRWFTNREGFELTLFTKLAIERLSHEEPLKLLAWSMKNETTDGEASLQVLAKSDPQALLDFFKENPNRDVEFQALAAIAKTQPDLAIARLIDLTASGTTENPYRFAAAMHSFAASSPEQLEAALDSLKGTARQTAEAALTGERLKQSFATEIQNLIDRPDGLTLLKSIWENSGQSVGETMLANLGSLPKAWQLELANNAGSMINSANAEKWLAADFEGAGITAEHANSIRKSCLSNLAYTQPEKAVREFLNLDRSSMDENNRNSFLQSVFSNQSDIATATSLINQLDHQADRQFAQQMVERNSSQFYNSARRVSTAQEWLEKAESLNSNSDSNNRYYLAEAVQSLNEGQLNQLGEELQNLPPETQRNVAGILTGMMGNVEVEPNLRGQAIQYLISNPAENKPNPSDPFGNSNNSTALASTHVAKWAQTDPAAASAWTSKLPDGEAKSWANKNLAATWMQYDPAAAKKWISNLPAATRNEVEQFLDSPGP